MPANRALQRRTPRSLRSLVRPPLNASIVGQKTSMGSISTRLPATRSIGTLSAGLASVVSLAVALVVGNRSHLDTLINILLGTGPALGLLAVVMFFRGSRERNPVAGLGFALGAFSVVAPIAVAVAFFLLGSD
jgi:hypothetical protein